MSMPPTSFTVQNKEYYRAKDIKEYDPAYFHGTSRAIRHIIGNKCIPDDKYLYASTSKRKGWTPAADQKKPSSKAALLLLKSWVETNVPKMSPAQLQDDATIKEAPGILGLDEGDKFKDEQGNVVEIETRGEREHDKVFFLVRDVAEAFDMPNLNTCLIHIVRRALHSIYM